MILRNEVNVNFFWIFGQQTKDDARNSTKINSSNTHQQYLSNRK